MINTFMMGYRQRGPEQLVAGACSTWRAILTADPVCRTSFYISSLISTVVATDIHIEVFVSHVACFLYLKAILPDQSSEARWSVLQ